MPDQSSAADEHAILQEITRPLETLPDDPLAQVDADFPTVLRGYDRIAVDDYVRETRRLVAELHATRSPEAAVRRALERVGEQISGILQRAHETAEQVAAQSRVEAENRLEQARAEAIEITRDAHQRVRDLDADTDRIWAERERIISDAEELAGQLQALARTAAARFPADAETEIHDGDELLAAGPDGLEGPDGVEGADEHEDPDGHDEGPAEHEDPDGHDDEGPAEHEPAGPEPEPTIALQPIEPEDTEAIPPASPAANRRRSR